MTFHRHALSLALSGLLMTSVLAGCGIPDPTVNEKGQAVTVDAQGKERRVFTAGETVPALGYLHADDILRSAAKQANVKDMKTAIDGFTDGDIDPREGIQHALDFMVRTHGLPGWYEEGTETSNDTRRRASDILDDPYILNMMTSDLVDSVKMDEEGVALPSVFANGSIGDSTNTNRWYLAKDRAAVPSSIYTLPTVTVEETENEEYPLLMKMSGSRTIEWETPSGLMLQPTSYSMTLVPTSAGWKVSEMEHEMQGVSKATAAHVRAEPATPAPSLTFHDTFVESAVEQQESYRELSLQKYFPEEKYDIDAAEEMGFAFAQRQANDGELRGLTDGELLVHPGGFVGVESPEPNSSQYHVSLSKVVPSDNGPDLKLSGLVESTWATEIGEYVQHGKWIVKLEPTEDGSWMVVDHDFEPSQALPLPGALG